MGKNKVEYKPDEHGALYNFFASIGHHWLKLMSTNVLFVVFNIPMMLVAFAIVLIILPTLNEVFVPENFVAFFNSLGVTGNEAIANDVGASAAYQVYYLITLFCVMFLLGSSLVCVGPFQAGFSTIYRNIARGQGAFIWADFKDGIKNNWKQSLIAMFISLIVTVVCGVAVGFYSASMSKIGTGISMFFVFIFFSFVVIQNIVYQMIVSVDLPLSKIYKNACLFFFLKFGPWIGIWAVAMCLLLLVPFLLLFTTTYFAYAVTVFYYLTVVCSLVQYMFSFYTTELIGIYIGKPKSYDDIGDDEAYDEAETESSGNSDDETEVET